MSAPRNSLDVVRYDWLGVRIGGPGASMRGTWPVLIVAMLVVFGCFFAVGRLSAAGGSPRQDSSAAPLARAAVPGKLRGGTPIPAAVPSAIAGPPRRSAAPAKRTEAVRPTAPFAVAGATTRTTTTSTTSANPPSEAALAQEAAPKQASTRSSGGGTRSSGSSGGGSAGRGAGRGGGAAGGSFDSSE
jgi:uncharacterized membrane protein YgcG